MDPLATPEAPGPSRPRRKRVQAKANKGDKVEIDAPQMPQVADARRRKKDEKRSKKAAVQVEKSRQTKSSKWADEWECVSIARNAVSAVPPVWSEDAR